MDRRLGTIIIEGVAPELDAGRHPVKRLAGTDCVVEADLLKEGHDVLIGVVRFCQRSPAPQATAWDEAPMEALGNDRFRGRFRLARPGRWAFTVEAWPDLFATWVTELTRKLEAGGRELTAELLEGAQLLEAAAERAAVTFEPDARRLRESAAILRRGPLPEVFAHAGESALRALAARYPDRTLATRYDRELEVHADRQRAEYGAWYEFFPRSALRDGRTHGTFRDAEAWLPYVESLGFDVLYLPPIHPIGRTARKGPNNSLTAGPDDVGSPWAIGASEGGHDSIHPRLGTPDDFRRFVQRAAEHGLEIALDLAFQCSPDHPWISEHPEWFQHRPDGSIKTAENPPKRYEDIVNFDWTGPAHEALWNALHRVVLHWVAQGVRIFRVDNPHTKPLQFWEWLIHRIQEVHPDVLFLAEAFTRPKVMKALAKRGFTQSYTYFTWRTFKRELEEYLTELTTAPVADYMRGNLWPNTPDILPELLQRGGPAAFRIRGALAATLSSTWGMYCGFELCEGTPLHGEEYLDSEKYELKAWDLDREGNIRDFITRLNRVRREHAAFQAYRALAFHEADNERVLFFRRSTDDGASQVLIAISLDPHAAQESLLTLPLAELGLTPTATYQVHELMQGTRALWQGPTAHVRLEPEHPIAIWQVLQFRRQESGFDYYA